MTIALERKQAGALAQVVHIGSYQLISDATLEEGSAAEGPSPHDLYDAALGACKALTVLWYAQKKGIPVDNIQTEVERDASGERAGVYKLATRLKISGSLTDSQLAELDAVAKKCPVHKLMTSVTTEITTQVERLP
jgi:putative redox protein